jgi:hemolysin activation/secretion protein
MYRKKLIKCGLPFSLLMISLAQAQTPPDAGMLRQQIEQGLPPLMPRPAPLERPAPPPAMQALPGDLTVREFRFVGNTLIKTELLQPAVADWLNRPLNFNQLQAAAAAVAQIYRDAGWIVRAYLPRQEIVDGIVTIQIVEALFGSVHFESGDVQRISQDRLQKGLAKTQTPGQPLNAEALDRSLLLLSDLPGVTVAGSLREGARQGESDVVLTVADKPLLAGDAAIDNTGSPSTGKVRLSANLALNSPFAFADQGNLNFLHTEGSDYLRLAYSIPLGYDGWRMGINTSDMRYKLISPAFAALNSFGSSATWGFDSSYPIYRSRLSNLYFNATLDHKSFDNSSAGATTTRYQLDTASAGISGNLTDTLGGGATSNASLTFTSGRVNLDGSPNQGADAKSTQTAGQFSKLRYAASRLQTLSESLTFNANLTGQIASKNLDSGERFYLGGSGGVRAYPGSEGGGSEGMMANLELRWRLVNGFNLTGFYDWGRVTVNRNNDFVGFAPLNRLSLQGGGLAFGWQGEGGFNLKLVWARRIGNNPNPTSTGNDQDGTLIRDRFWLNANLPF